MNQAGEMNNPCPLCGGDRTNGLTTFTVELGFGVVVVRHVPATVRDQCGEGWIANQVAEHLEVMVERAHADHATVAFTDWRKRAG